MSTEGMSDLDFFLELAEYDVIRPATWQSWTMAASNETALSAQSASSSSRNPSQPQALPRLDAEAGFWKNLETYLGSKYDPDDCDLFIDLLQDKLEEKMKKLSLNELERLAARIKKPAPQTTLTL